METLDLSEPKKEIQKTIIDIPLPETKSSDEEFTAILRSVAPGTNIRTALEGIVKIGKGALIVVENEFTDGITDGGFKLNCRFTPQKLMELSKMDGALILSKDMKKIMYANAMMTPDSGIPTTETGTRHRAAERTAKMTGTLTIAVSERKNEIHLYYKDIKYPLKDSSEVLRKTQFTLQLLEKQRELFDHHIAKLNELELRNEQHLTHTCKVIQKGESMQRMLKAIEKNLIELGNEATATKARIKELMLGVKEETDLVIKDYTKLNTRKSKNLLEALSYDELLDIENILTALAQKETNVLESIKGWRLLAKTNISEQEASLILRELNALHAIIKAEETMFAQILGPEKANIFAKTLKRLKSEHHAA